jgi:hypothetical protein
MSTTTDYFNQAELSLAAYSNLYLGTKGVSIAFNF